jgi:hypothetical protein
MHNLALCLPLAMLVLAPLGDLLLAHQWVAAGRTTTRAMGVVTALGHAPTRELEWASSAGFSAGLGQRHGSLGQMQSNYCSSVFLFQKYYLFK